jgi:3-methyladenine DNA glycosylase/8-oxoguanine DNA glycosylase
MPAHVVCPTLSTMCSELLSGRPRPESGFDDDRYVRLLAVDPVLRSIARVQGRPDPFAWFVAGGAGATNFAAMVLHIGSQQISTRAALAVFDRIQDAAGGRTQLRRPDVLPAGDLGIRRAVQRCWSRPALPPIEEVRQMGERWSPDRTYAAALLWASLRGGPDH